MDLGLAEWLGIANLPAAIYSLAASGRYLGWVRRRSGAAGPSSYRPSVTLLVPCCGAEEGLAENVRAFFAQAYSRLEIVFVVETEADEALPIVRGVCAAEDRPARVVIAGPASERGQKVHNLAVALAAAPRADVLAFADSDCRPDPGWLERLVAPLQRKEIGVATGYRFYLPEPGSFGSLLRSVWNAGVLTLFGDHNHNFAWGGSMALRSEVFEEARVAEAWRGALSDDYALTHAVRRAGYRVEFVPSCLVASQGRAGVVEVARWCTRQMAITRVYWRNLWRIAGGSQVLFSAFLLAAAAALARGDRGVLPLLALLLGLSWTSGALRFQAVLELAPRWRERLRERRAAYVLLTPFTSLLTAYAFLLSAASRRIEWRGKSYVMKSPSETILREREIG